MPKDLIKKYQMICRLQSLQGKEKIISFAEEEYPSCFKNELTTAAFE